MTAEFGPHVAVEFDLYSDEAQDITTIRLCNKGPMFSTLDPADNYEPRLVTPIQLGTAISVQSYGQPQRALSNQGSIEFLLDPDYMDEVFSEGLHWIGRTFRVYEGQLTSDRFVQSLDLVFTGRITDATHDTKRAVIRTGDASNELDVPLVTDLYPTDALPAIAGKPKPQIWGTVFCIEPVLEDAVNLVYRISRTPIEQVIELRVGGIAWTQSAANPPGEGEYYVDTFLATVTLGSVTLGGDVRCDVEGEAVRGTADLVTKIIGNRLSINRNAFRDVDDLLAATVGYYAKDPINALNAIDDIVTGNGCWWGMTPNGRVTIGIIAAPGEPDIDTTLDNSNVLSITLSQMIPPAWRVRVEYERHWQTEGQFFDAMEETEKQRWAAPGQLVSREDSTTLIAEPRAFDVPTMRSVSVTVDDGSTIADVFWNAWDLSRRVLDVVAWVDPRVITLYGTIAVNYMSFQKNYRILSAIKSIGGGPAQLQLWG